MIRGIRGAITAPANDAGEIIQSTQLLLKKMVETNRLQIGDIISILFSATADLNQTFPAKAARMLGWSQTPLMCHVEIDVPGALPRCIRVLMLVDTDLRPEEICHIYLGNAKKLRDDLFSTDEPA